MADEIIVRARIDERIKSEAAAVLAEMDMTVSDALQLLLIRVATEKALPFKPLVPNETTVAAMQEAHEGGLPRFETVDALMADLRADD